MLELLLQDRNALAADPVLAGDLVLAGETGAGAASPPLRRPSAADLLNILAGDNDGVGDLGGRFAPPFFKSPDCPYELEDGR